MQTGALRFASRQLLQPRRRARGSKPSATPRRFWKNICACIIRLCAAANRFSRNSIRTISRRSDIAATRASSANSARCKTDFAAATKFECLTRYRCANLFFLVLPNELFREPEVPLGWGALVEAGRLTRRCAEADLARQHAGKSAAFSASHRAGRHAPSEPAVRDQFRARAGRAAAPSNCSADTSRLCPVISCGCGKPSRKRSVGATSARIPSSTRNFAASFGDINEVHQVRRVRGIR